MSSKASMQRACCHTQCEVRVTAEPEYSSEYKNVSGHVAYGSSTCMLQPLVEHVT